MSVGVIPSSLKKCKGWLVWKSIANKGSGKPRKVPHYASTGKWRKGIQGGREDRQGLVGFKEAVKVKRTSKRDYNGIGIAMLPDWGLVAVDFDDCIGADNCIVPEVYDLVLGTYWELSPSGRGVRAFFTGYIRDAKSLGEVAKARGWGVEFFCSKGFVTVTGNVLEEVEMFEPEIIPLTSGILDLYENCFGHRGIGVGGSEGVGGEGTEVAADSVGMTDDEIQKMLKLWSPDCSYDEWVSIGMAVHHETHGEGSGFELWNEWSCGGAEYAGYEDCQSKWESFGIEGKGSLKTIRWMLRDKPIGFVLENVGNDFEPLGDLKDEKGVAIRGLPMLKMNSKGDIEPTPENVVAWLSRDDLSGVGIKLDSFKDEITLHPCGEVEGGDAWRVLSDEDYMRFRMHLGSKKFKVVSKDLVRDAVALIGAENRFDSAIEWLQGLEWDGVPRVETFMSVYMGAENNEYTRAVGMYAWTAHAGRVVDGGCKADMIPVLVGPQRKGKSECVQAIAPSAEFFAEMAFNHRDDDLARRMRGRLVVECAELSGLGGKETEAVKAFVTRTHENWVPKYKEHAVVYPRRFLFWGTSNNDDFLVDATGNRRWLPVRVNGGQRRMIERDREQLWAEGLALWSLLGVEGDEAVRLAEGVHDDFIAEDMWQELVVSWLTTLDSDGVQWGKKVMINNEEIMLEALGLAGSACNNTVRCRLRDIMLRLNYKLGRLKGIDGGRKRGWIRQGIDD